MRFLSNHRGFVRSFAVVLIAAGAILAVTQMNQAQTQGPVSGRQPIITNQFSATTGGSLQQRAPGNQVQLGLQEATGGSTFLVGDATPPEPKFLSETIELLFLELLDQISQIFSSLNLLAGGNPLSGLLGGTGGLGSLFGGLTGGTGTIPIS